MQRGWVVSPHYRIVIEALKAARSDRDISQRELARRIGKPPSFINKIEQLERRLDVLEFIAIASAMQMEPTELLKTITARLPKAVEI